MSPSLLQAQTFPDEKYRGTLKLITLGRRTGLPHIAEVRYATIDGSFFLLAGSLRSDWVLNALRSGEVRAKIGEKIYRVNSKVATVSETAATMTNFRSKYGTRVVDEWYKLSEGCIRLDPIGPPTSRGAVKGETDVETSFSQWKGLGLGYYDSVREAFDSASEEYDYTISRNYINTWIRKRSIDELAKLTRQSDVLLEIGCGTGTEAIKISKSVSGIIATDISERMLQILDRKLAARRLSGKIVGVKIRASEVAKVRDKLPDGKVRVAYSFNGALDCEPEIDKVPEQLAQIIDRDGYFLCSIRNTLCLSETLTHSIALQMDKVAVRKHQPVMVSVGGINIPSYYYSPESLARFFQSYFRVKRMIGLPAFLPPAYLNDYYLQTGPLKPLLEKLEFVLGSRFPFNRLGDQTLIVFQRR